MKTIKVLLIALVAFFTFEGAKAQTVVRTRVVHRHYYHHRPVHRRVVVTHRVHRPYHHRAVVVHRTVVRHY